MFSANDYVQKRYANAKERPTEPVIQKLQGYVDASGLAEHEAYVETLLDVLTPPGKLRFKDMVLIPEWFRWAAAIRRLGGPWEKALTSYLHTLNAEDGGPVFAEFYKRCLGTDLLPLQKAEAESVAMTKPLVVINPPVVEKQIGAGLQGTIQDAKKEEISIGMGLFEVVVGFQAPKGHKGHSTMGVLQFVSGDRVATYSDGTTLRRTLEHALDSHQAATSERPPWFKDVSVTVAADESAVLVVNDAPKWNFVLRDKNRTLVKAAINDHFKMHVVALTDPKTSTFTKLYTCEWTFTAVYDAADPGAAAQSYTLISSEPASGVIQLTGKEQLANRVPETTTTK